MGTVTGLSLQTAMGPAPSQVFFASGNKARTRGSSPSSALVQGSPAPGCWCGLTLPCRIPNTIYKGLQEFHTGRVWPCHHHTEGKLRHRDQGLINRKT